ncbi:MAG: DUF3786 domain-containing protein [Candidatus Calditenuis sp.]|jgi:hypothetical protein|nr:DUF3786 domain-containing protein [Candidatus Calditenuis sp.]MDT7967952.1 DUF3786 domain-containing protein [Candidatus Calditenuis sp.]
MALHDLLSYLKTLDPKEVSRKCEVAYLPPKEEKGPRYLVNVLDLTYCFHLSDGTAEEVVKKEPADPSFSAVIAKYLANQVRYEPQKGWVGIEKFVNAQAYHSEYVRKVLRPMIEAFGTKADLFIQSAVTTGGRKEKLGGISFSFKFFPRLLTLVQLWPSSDTVLGRAEVSIKFSPHAVQYLEGRDAMTIAEFLVKRLLHNRTTRRRSVTA